MTATAARTWRCSGRPPAWFVLYRAPAAPPRRHGALSTDQPFAHDFDGDGRADLAVYRPSSGQWFLQLSTTTFGATLTGRGAWPAICR
jgi:hypothetical protein